MLEDIAENRETESRGGAVMRASRFLRFSELVDAGRTMCAYEFNDYAHSRSQP
jgi:hypothetical protein